MLVRAHGVSTPAPPTASAIPPKEEHMRRNRLLPLFASSSIAFFGVMAWAPQAIAATLPGNTPEDATAAKPGEGQCATDGGQCSLRAAIQEANMLPGPDTVKLPAGTYLIAREGADEDQCAKGDLDITSSIDIVGDG